MHTKKSSQQQFETPNSNVDAPINVGNTAQVKSGNMGANVVSAVDQMWSPEYCDENGDNCAAAAGGGSIPEQVGHAGEFLTTDGTNTSWQAGGATAISSCTLDYRFRRNNNEGAWQSIQLDGTSVEGAWSTWSVDNVDDDMNFGHAVQLFVSLPIYLAL